MKTIVIIILVACVCGVLSGCRNTKKESMDLSWDGWKPIVKTTKESDRSFDLRWSNKEAIIKTGNIGLVN